MVAHPSGASTSSLSWLAEGTLCPVIEVIKMLSSIGPSIDIWYTASLQHTSLTTDVVHTLSVCQ